MPHLFWIFPSTLLFLALANANTCSLSPLWYLPSHTSPRFVGTALDLLPDILRADTFPNLCRELQCIDLAPAGLGPPPFTRPEETLSALV